MQATNQLHTNTTNRQPILPQPFFNISIRSINSQFSFVKTSNPQLKSLTSIHDALAMQLEQAKQQQRIMQELFDSLAKAERGETKLIKKMQRRCNKDILDRFYCHHENCKRFYSSQTSLQRHVKIKHHSGRKEPPQPFHDLPPQPNLTEQTESEIEEEISLETKRGEIMNNKELV